MIREKAPTILTAEGARRLTARIRDALSLADDLLAQAYEGRVWEALRLPSWEAWCEEMIPELQAITLRAPERQARTAKLLEQGATEREIAAATGASAATAHRDVVAVTGRKTPAPASNEAADLPTYWQVVHAIGKCGPAGGTTREVMKRLRWEQGPASAALSRAVKKGLLTATGERRHAYGASIGHMVYVVAE